MDAAFAQAHRLCVDKIALPERKNALGQMRHCLSEEGFRAAGQAAKLGVHVPDTEPKGSRYSVVESAGIFMVRSNVLSHCQQPRPTVFRRRWSSLNEWLRPSQIDLFNPSEDGPPKDRMCAMVVTTAGRNGDPQVPMFAGIGIPTADLSTWISLTALSDIIALYNKATEQTETPVDIVDRAVPKLKRRGTDRS